jgi:F420-non-reducing hydrogenase iron-sulfur subunit
MTHHDKAKDVAKTATAAPAPTAWEPRIVAFCCNWCSYAGADLAGVSRVQMPSNFRIVRIMCSGRVDPAICAQLLREGMDGVLVLGCHPGDCHYLEGNYFAEIKMQWARYLMSKTSMGDGRLMLDWVSASEGQRFADIVTGFQQSVKALGPNPVLKEGSERLREEVDAIIRTLSDFRLRALMGKVRTIRDDGNVYGETKKRSELDALVADAVESEYVRNAILVAAMDRDWTVVQLAKHLGRPTEQVMKHVVRLRQRNLLGLTRIEGLDPYYKTLGGV